MTKDESAGLFNKISVGLTVPYSKCTCCLRIFAFFRKIFFTKRIPSLVKRSIWKRWFFETDDVVYIFGDADPVHAVELFSANASNSSPCEQKRSIRQNVQSKTAP